MNEINLEEQRLRSYIEDAVGRRQDRLPPEPQLSALLNIPRGKLRTYLKRLEKDGLIWRHVGKGTFLGPRTGSVPELSPLDSLSASHVVDSRLLIEPLLAGKAAVHARQADIVAMERCLEDMAGASSYATWKSGDDRLHHAIAEAAQNPLLLMLHDVVHAYARKLISQRMEQTLGRDRAPVESSNSEHRAIVAEIKRHNPEGAEAAMRRHLYSIRNVLFGDR